MKDEDYIGKPKNMESGMSFHEKGEYLQLRYDAEMRRLRLGIPQKPDMYDDTHIICPTCGKSRKETL